ncbi:hypothetical protein AB6F89_11400 [Providencia hangzhouensis]|uniref:hypothetical protein n=1 Tax=Providencia hangzhouensis TaxID=3031799 RepID=UPI002AB3DF1D|nr:hypothetical protein [Providencia rettgeri]
MRNTIFNADSLYNMLKDTYLEMFPVEPSKYLHPEFTNIYIHSLNVYYQKRDLPVTITFSEQYLNSGKLGEFQDNIVIRKNLETISKLTADEQDKIIEYVDDTLEYEVGSILQDIKDMHTWLILNDYLSEYEENGLVHTYITEKYIKTTPFFSNGLA